MMTTERRYQACVDEVAKCRQPLFDGRDLTDAEMTRLRAAKDAVVAAHHTDTREYLRLRAGWLAYVADGGGEPYMIAPGVISVCAGPVVGGASIWVRPDDPQWTPLLARIISRFRRNGGKREHAPAYMLEAWPAE